MPFNNYSNYGNYGAYQSPAMPNNVRPTVPANNGSYGYNTGFNGNYMNNGYQPNPNPTPVQDDRWIFSDYVSGRAGADAYQMPTGVNKVLLFDNDTNRMYIKGYDNNGRPRVLEDNDFQPHVDPEPQSNPTGIDLTPYATKEDIKQMITGAINGIQLPNLSQYVTKEDLRNAFDKELTTLSVGNGGRIVRNEPNA
jgi:hypothetical protein